MPEEKFVFDSLQDSDSIKEFLGALTEGFAKERIVLSTNGDDIVLNPSGLLEFSVKAKKKRDLSRISIKIGWKEGQAGEPGEDSKIRVGT